MPGRGCLGHGAGVVLSWGYGIFSNQIFRAQINDDKNKVTKQFTPTLRLARISEKVATWSRSWRWELRREPMLSRLDPVDTV